MTIELSLSPPVKIEAGQIDEWIAIALGIPSQDGSMQTETGEVTVFGAYNAGQATQISALLQKHADLLLTSDVMAFAADNIATATVTVTVSNKANENFDVLVYEESAGVGSAITESVALDGVGVGTLTLGATSEPGVYVVELISADYFGRLRVEAIR